MLFLHKIVIVCRCTISMVYQLDLEQWERYSAWEPLTTADSTANVSTADVLVLGYRFGLGG